MRNLGAWEDQAAIVGGEQGGKSSYQIRGGTEVRPLDMEVIVKSLDFHLHTKENHWKILK